MDNAQVYKIAFQIRSSNIKKNNTFTISTRALSQLLVVLDTIDEQSTSFHVKPANLELTRDLQFLATYIQQTKSLKLYDDNYHEPPTIDISKFTQLRQLELCKVDIDTVKGLQIFRPQLHKIVCQKEGTLNNVFVTCGGDKSPSYCWNELKEASFINCRILTLDESLECVPWLHTVDLSHNDIRNIESVSCLHNLKCLNLSYNKLEAFPVLKGQICSRLQNLVLKNNFIEDIGGLRSLTNLCVLDLSNNCLIDHKSLLALAHSATLQYLNLTSNPLYFHPNHRNQTAGYLHVNTASTNFVLNNVALTKNEKKLVGSYYPHQTNLSTNDSMNTPSEKVRKVRHVLIEEGDVIRETTIPKLSSSPQQYLETKKQIEDLHEKFGESWLNSQSGILDVLGLEDSVRLSSSPYSVDFTLYSGDFDPRPNKNVAEVKVEAVISVDKSDELNEEYAPRQESPEILDDPDVEGEETIYIATISAETEPIFIVIGQTHISEKESATSIERVRWHVDSIINCEIIDENQVQIDFETMRKDRKQRIYLFEDEINEFMACIKKKINGRQPKKAGSVKYQCMKCSVVFAGVKNESVLGEKAVKCPNCDSTLVVEDV